MYDHQTESLWHNLTGEPVVGSLAQSGIKLQVLPVTITSWEQWLRDHPETTVLDINTGHQRDYTQGKAYGAYFARPETMFPVAPRDQRLPAKSYVFALRIGDQPKAYPLDLLGAKKVLNDTVGGTNLVIVANAETRTARAYARRERQFAVGTSVQELVDQDGAVWRVQEDHLTHAQSGEQLPRLGGHVSYWFGWYAFYPQTQVYQEGGK